MRRSLLIAVLLSAAWAWRAVAETPPFEPPAHWKTYTNTKYGFQFKYPPQLAVRERFRLQDKTVFSGKLKSGLFSVTLLEKGDYAGFSVVVEKKDDLFFRSKALSGFYKYDSVLNSWLGYNPISTEYGHPQRIYFYLGTQMCALEEALGPDHLPTYGTAKLVSASDPHNDIILTNQTYGIEIPREDSGLEAPGGQMLSELQENIRNTFQLIDPVKSIRADCTSEVLAITTTTVPTILEPAMGQTLNSHKPVPVKLEKVLPPEIGLVFFLILGETSDTDKIVFETPVADIPSGEKGMLHCDNAQLSPSDTGTTPMVLHAYFYKLVHGRKVLLGEDFHRVINILVK